jgi:hypothetical protein
MSLPLILGCFWAVAAGLTAMLPMRMQYAPGLFLLVAAPVLIVWIGVAHGVWAAALAFLGFASMFRNPLIYLARKAAGRPAHRPEERS